MVGWIWIVARVCMSHTTSTGSTPTAGPDLVPHYNGYLSAEINGAPAPGYSSGQAQALIAEVAHSATGVDIHPGARIGSSFFIVFAAG